MGFDLYLLDNLRAIVYNCIMLILDAALDTSFWNRASEIGITPYLFQFFRVHVCSAVRQEIVTTDPNETPLIYPQAMLFQIFEEDGRLLQAEPIKPLSRFGAGEAGAIALAIERNWHLLINDSRPLLFARSLGLSCVSVPAFCLLLYQQRKITYQACLGYLVRLSATTTASLISQAREVARVLAVERGDAI